MRGAASPDSLWLPRNVTVRGEQLKCKTRETVCCRALFCSELKTQSKRTNVAIRTKYSQEHRIQNKVFRTSLMPGNTCVERTRICDNASAAVSICGGSTNRRQRCLIQEIQSVFGMSHAPHAATLNGEKPSFPSSSPNSFPSASCSFEMHFLLPATTLAWQAAPTTASSGQRVYSQPGIQAGAELHNCGNRPLEPKPPQRIADLDMMCLL